MRSNCCETFLVFETIDLLGLIWFLLVKKTANRRFLSRLDEMADCFIPNSNEVGRIDEKSASRSMNQLTTKSSFQGNMQTLEKNMCDKVRCEVDNVSAAVKSRGDEAILSAMDSSVVLKFQLAMRSGNASAAPNANRVLLDPGQGNFSKNADGLHLIALNRLIWLIWNKITDEAGNLLVLGREFDRQTSNHHNYTKRKSFPSMQIFFQWFPILAA